MYKPGVGPKADVEWDEEVIILACKVESLTTAIEPQEYEAAVRKLAQGSLGNDGIDAAIIKALPQAAHAKLRAGMSNLLVHQLLILLSWGEASIMLLPKEGLVINPMNY